MSPEIWAAPYELKSRSGAKPARVGSLLRVLDPEFGEGFSDLHPWPEFGDLPLIEQLKRLVQGDPTSQARLALDYANRDAEFRTEHKSSWTDRESPASHFLIGEISDRSTSDVEADLETATGFSALKIKLGRAPDTELKHLTALASKLEKWNLRLDFNSTLSESEFSEYVARLPSGVRSKIEFVEDPFAWNSSAWAHQSSELGLPFALDRISETELERVETVSTLIHKAAVQDSFFIGSQARRLKARICVTSYLDHPLGQMSAAFQSTELQAAGFEMTSGGFASHLVYQATPYSERILFAGGKLRPVSGTGLGFDDLLEKEKWRKIAGPK